jgi:hypothetical protein
VIHYVIIEARTPYDLQKEVNFTAKSGYRPVGGVAVSTETESIGQTYLQAMIRPGGLRIKEEK